MVFWVLLKHLLESESMESAASSETSTQTPHTTRSKTKTISTEVTPTMKIRKTFREDITFLDRCLHLKKHNLHTSSISQKMSVH